MICNNFSRIIPFILFNLSPWALLSAGFLVESSKQSRWMSSKIWRWVGWAHTNREIQEDMYTILYMNTQYIYIYDYDDYDYIYSCPHRLFAHNYIATICIVAFGSSKTSQILLFIGCRQLFKGSAPARPWWTLHRWCATQAEEEEAQEALRSRNLWGAPASIDMNVQAMFEKQGTRVAIYLILFWGVMIRPDTRIIIGILKAVNYHEACVELPDFAIKATLLT